MATPHAHTSSQVWSLRAVETVLQRHPVLSRRWHYEPGVILLAIARAWERAGSLPDHPYYAYIRRSMDAFITPEGGIRTYDPADYNLDQINQGRLLFPLCAITGEARYRTAAQALRQQLAGQPRNAVGGFWHKLRYPHQMWLDGVYMAAPFYTQYGAVFDDPSAFDDVARQVALLEAHARDPQTGLLYHAWDALHREAWADPQSGCSPHFWGRAVGWFMMALPDILDYFPGGHPDHPALVAIFQNIAAAVQRVQDPNTGVWYQILDQASRDGNYREASASCMFVYALARGARLGWLGAEALHSARRGFQGILEQFITLDDNGWVNLHGICAVAGLGGTPYRNGTFDYYVSEPVISNDFKGFGAFVLAALEIEALSEAGL